MCGERNVIFKSKVAKMSLNVDAAVDLNEMKV